MYYISYIVYLTGAKTYMQGDMTCKKEDKQKDLQKSLWEIFSKCVNVKHKRKAILIFFIEFIYSRCVQCESIWTRVSCITKMI